jgi:hypothetical protein
MRLKRIKIDRRKNNVAPIQTCLRVEQNVIAVGGKETDVGEVMQRGILVANPVHQSDKLLDIARPVPVAHLDRVFLRVQIFLRTRDRLVLAHRILRMSNCERDAARARALDHLFQQGGVQPQISVG